MKPIEAAELVLTLAASYPAAPITEATSRVYERQLADLDREAAQAAIERLINTSRFFPTVAEIRSAAVELTRGARRLGSEAWGDVLAEIRRVGIYDSPSFKDPIVAECVRIMTWRGLCLGENEAADRARFVDLYDGLADRDRRDAVAGPRLALPPPPAQPDRMKELLSGVGAGLFLTEANAIEGAENG